MSDSLTPRENKLAQALLRVARTNSQIIMTLDLLQSRTAPGDKAIEEAIKEAMTQFEAQLAALEDVLNG